MTHPIFADIAAIMPEVILGAGTMLLMVIGAFGRGGAFKPVSALALVLWASVAAYLCMGASAETQRVFDDMLVLDSFARTIKILIAGGAMAALLIAVSDIKDTILARFEYPVLISFASFGMFIMVSANDLLTLYIGLELSSLSLYVLAAFDRNNNASSEAGLKYFVLGAISSGLLLFGASLIYGYVGSTQFDVIAATLSAAAVPGPASLVVLFGMILMICALAFKISAVPFHMWTPDVYAGAPTPVTAFFAIVPKLAAMCLFVRLLTGPFGALANDWVPVITLLSVASMVVGAFAAIVQTNLKRLIAYSSIGNMGYVLLGVLSNSQVGLASVIMYFVIYMVMTAGTFGIIMLLRRDGEAVSLIKDLSGLSKTHPVHAYGLAILMFSMSGIPPMAGFFGKYAVFLAAVSAQVYVVAVVGVLTSVVAAWYYINIIRVMFFEPADAEKPVTLNTCYGARAVVVASLLFVVVYIIAPQGLAAIASDAASSLFK